MANWSIFRLCVLVAVFVSVPLTRAQPTKAAESLTVEEVVKLAEAGFSEDVVITRIRKNGKAFDLNAAELVELKKLGLSDAIIKYLLDPSQPYTPAPPPQPMSPSKPEPPAPPGPPLKRYPADEHASKVPPEVGLYRFPTDTPVRLDIKVLLGTNEGAGLGKVLMKKGKVLAYLLGPSAKTRIKEPAPAFYMRLPEGKAIEDIVLVACDHKKDRREIEMGPPGPKPEFKAEALRQFDFLEVGQNLYRLTTAKLAKGEYLFFQLGSAEPPKGSYGKGFDFGIDDSHK